VAMAGQESSAVLLPPFSTRGSGFKSATGGVIYIMGISKCYNLRNFFSFPFREPGCFKHFPAYK